MTIPKPALQMAISCLEKYANHPDTAAIHDPIYALLKGEDLGQQKALERALSAHTSHPAAVELRSILGEELSLGPPSLAGVLERYGPLVDSEDLVHEVDRRLHQHRLRLTELRAERERLERALMQSRQSSNAIAALGAFGAMFALVGWAIALGLLEVQWIDSPAASLPASAAAGQGTPTPAHLRPKARP